MFGAALAVADGGVDVVGRAGGEGAVVGNVAFVVEVAENVHGGADAGFDVASQGGAAGLDQSAAFGAAGQVENAAGRCVG